MQSHNYNGTIGHIKKIEIRQLFYCRLPLLRVRKKAASALSSNRSKVPRTTSASEPLREITKIEEPDDALDLESHVATDDDTHYESLYDVKERHAASAWGNMIC